MSSLSIRSFTLFREEQPVRDALVLFTLTLLLHRITELFNQLLLAADDEMVKAKQSGRNQICMPTLTESAP